MSSKFSSTMIKPTEQFPSGLPPQLKPIWMQSYVMIVPMEYLWQESTEDLNDSIIVRASVSASHITSTFPSLSAPRASSHRYPNNNNNNNNNNSSRVKKRTTTASFSSLSSSPSGSGAASRSSSHNNNNNNSNNTNTRARSRLEEGQSSLPGDGNNKSSKRTRNDSTVLSQASSSEYGHEEPTFHHGLPLQSTSRVFIRSQWDTTNNKPWLHEQEKQLRVAKQLSDNLGQMKLDARSAWNRGEWKTALDLLEKYSEVKSYVFETNHSEAVQAKTLYLIMMSNYAAELCIKGEFSKGFSVFKTIEAALNEISVERFRLFLNAVLYNNMANYYYRKKKLSVTARYSRDAYKFWRKIDTVPHTLYFLLRSGTALCLAGNFQDAEEQLSNAILVMEETSSLVGRGQPIPCELEYRMPHVLTDVSGLVSAVVQFNYSMTQVAIRQYAKAENMCQKTLDLFQGMFDQSHPFCKHVSKAHKALGEKVNGPTFDQFKLKSDLHVHKGYLSTMSRPVRESLIQSMQETERKSIDFLNTSSGGPERKQKKLQSVFPFLKYETTTPLFSSPSQPVRHTSNRGKDVTNNSNIGRQSFMSISALSEVKISKGRYSVPKVEQIDVDTLPPVTQDSPLSSSRLRQEDQFLQQLEQEVRNEVKNAEIAIKEIEEKRTRESEAATKIQTTFRRMSAQKKLRVLLEEETKRMEELVLQEKREMADTIAQLDSEEGLP